MLHGPEIIDSGCALKLIEKLQRMGRVTAVLGGTMGRVALIDAELKDKVQNSPRRRPSQSIQDLEESSDIIFLLNLAKSRESGLSFGAMVAQAAGEGKPLIHIDCGGRFVSLLRGDEEAAILADRLAFELGLDLIRPGPMGNTGKEDQRGTVSRTLNAVCPGELISINGTVIGRAIESRVEIKAKEGRIVHVKGAAVKRHGLEKLDYVDLKRAIIRSGSIRRTEPPFKRVKRDAREKIVDLEEAAYIDHSAEDAFEAASGAGVAVTVGDDTTAIAGDILSRMGTLVMGIVDGDPDHLAEGTGMMQGSIIFRVQPGHDDVVGREVKCRIFQGKERITVSPAELAEKIKAIAGSHLLQIEQV